MRPVARRPPRRPHPPHRLEIGRALRRLERALPIRPLDEGLRVGGNSEGGLPARLRARRDPAVGRPRRVHQEALAPDRADQGEEGDADRGLQVGPLLRVRRSRQRRRHDARDPRWIPRPRRPSIPRAAPPPIPPRTATSPRAPPTGRRRCRTCRRPPAAEARETASSAIASRSRRRATPASSRTATPWTSSSERSARRDCRRDTPRASTRT